MHFLHDEIHGGTTDLSDVLIHAGGMLHFVVRAIEECHAEISRDSQTQSAHEPEPIDFVDEQGVEFLSLQPSAEFGRVRSWSIRQKWLTPVRCGEAPLFVEIC